MSAADQPVHVLRGRSPVTGQVLEVSYTREGILAVLPVAEQLPVQPRDPELPLISSGLIDLQVNGCFGIDLNGDDLRVADVIDLGARLARLGVTTWLPTLVTAPEAAISRALATIEEARQRDPDTGAAIPCVHVEGPFISAREGFRGVHDPAQIRPLDAAEVLRWQAAGAPIGLVTVSPHTEDAPEQIRRIVAAGISVALGHTHASPEQLRAAVNAGATLSTHLGNGLPTLLPRHPNAIWTQLAEDRLSCGLIADGHHLPWDTLEVMLSAKGSDGAFLVSDATAIAGLPPGHYTTAVGGQVELDEAGRLSYSGTELLAGSAATLPAGLRLLLRHTSRSLAQALQLTVGTPGRIADRWKPGAGRLEAGAPADLVLLSAEGEVLQVVANGTDLGAA
ncbi:N-acetylglucosamine-6-phosphate deacetylase [Psychromicrobium xiongbiense]|uniref:N-acetylglucosamine-6-phosphate deacetylase n=1 Tax=Psychromicrobium xiongbiense TaxID=3051184 RepID=UPI002556FEA4|nr:amidohydrolase family protein [Psychromicrobium sp. YIM S02556]